MFDSSEVVILLISLIIIVLIYIILKLKSVPINKYNELEENYSKSKEEYTKLIHLKDENEKLLQRISQNEIENKELLKENTKYKTNNENLIINCNELIEKIETLENKNNDLSNKIQEIRDENTNLKAENKSAFEKLETQKKGIEELNSKFQKEFENLANKILDEKSERFSKSNQEQVKSILEPLNLNISDFKKKVEDTFLEETKQRNSTEERIKALFEATNQISEDAKNLTQALKGDVKKQGNWGETILTKILENSGLIKDTNYTIQESYKGEDGKTKYPDIIIKFPDKRNVVIDSKVSLVSYERFSSAVDEDARVKALNELIVSLKSHIDNLSSKDYTEFENSIDFVFLFIPLEPAFLTAINYDKNLWSYAYNKKIVLISSTTLIATLKLIEDLWKKDYQNKNAMEIAKLGASIYDKVHSFLKDFEKLEGHIKKASETYDTAYNKLTTGRENVIRQTEKLKELGVKTDKQIDDKHIKELLE